MREKTLGHYWSHKWSKSADLLPNWKIPKFKNKTETLFARVCSGLSSYVWGVAFSSFVRKLVSRPESRFLPYSFFRFPGEWRNKSRLVSFHLPQEFNEAKTISIAIAVRILNDTVRQNTKTLELFGFLRIEFQLKDRIRTKQEQINLDLWLRDKTIQSHEKP